MVGRSVLSRPRTKVYDVNYDIGQSYYKPALDKLDQKYSLHFKRDTNTPNKSMFRSDSLPRDSFLDRKARSNDINDNVDVAGTVFDSRGAKTTAGKSLSSFFEESNNNFNDEMTSAINRIQASHKFNKALDDIEMDSAINDIQTKRFLNKSEKMLDSVGLNDNGIRKVFEDEPIIKKGKKSELTKWTAITDDESMKTSGPRTKIMRARLQDLDDEMDAIAERQAYREQRLAHLKNLVSSFDSDIIDERPISSTKIQMKSEKRSVRF